MADPWKRYPLLSSGQSFKVDRFLMKNPWAKPAGACLIALILMILAYLIGKGLSGPDLEPFSMSGQSRLETEDAARETIRTVEVRVPGEPGKIIEYTGADAYLVGGWGDNLRWDGIAVNPIDGVVSIKVDPSNNIGSLVADLKEVSINSEDRTFLRGDVRIEFNAFFAREGWQEGGMREEVELFGNTDRETIQLPRVTARLAGWGTAEVLLDGQSVYSKLPAFFMINDALRRDDNSITLRDGTIYSPKQSSKGGFTDPSRREITIMLHSDDIDKKNKPQNAVFIHLVFKDVREGLFDTSAIREEYADAQEANETEALGSNATLDGEGGNLSQEGLVKP